jgi:hypothetical protein
MERKKKSNNLFGIKIDQEFNLEEFSMLEVKIIYDNPIQENTIISEDATIVCRFEQNK